MKKKIALITGVTGQDGSYLAEFLLKKNYIVHGIIRRSSSLNSSRIDHIYEAPNKKNRKFILHYSDLSDSLSLEKIINNIRPDEIYNLAAQSHVATSFKIPEYTSNINALGVLRILEIIKNQKKKIKFYQASTSELYGLVNKKKQNEGTRFYPRSPYAISKLFGYWITRHYREAYNIFASNGILFNHESPRRGHTFVTKKITAGLSRICLGLQDKLVLGNLNSLRDWGHAKDYAKMQWKILQYRKAEDFVISTDYQITVRKFVELVAYKIGFLISWKGKGLNEKGYVSKIYNHINKYSKLRVGQGVVIINKNYFRVLDVENLRGDSSKAKKILKWKPKYNLSFLIEDMVNTDLKEAENIRKLNVK